MSHRQSRCFSALFENAKGLSLLYVLGLINSKLFSRNFIWSSEIAKRDDFPQLDIATVKEFPIRRINFITPKEEREKCVNKLKELYHQEKFNAILDLIDSYLIKDEEGNFSTEKEKSDVVHDFIAFLAEQMLKMNKEKNEEIKGFLKWLKGDTGVKVEDMNLKTKIRNYYKYDWTEFKNALLKNKRKIRSYDVSRRVPQERIKLEFNASIGKLKPLFKKIEKTDDLIDKIVYKLYGLTDEEIKMVEGSSMF